ncbi:hypothetical protein ACJO2E_08680 [Marinobacter sp. M1N3S26]|uniref:hypothetical protein n=1 Tax=Marinobacter sp. M1N3S26 TaxID=3382299 RepID=UPI00387B035A
MNIHLTQRQAIALLVTVNREIRDNQAILRKTTNPVLKAMVQESIEEKRRIAQVIDQAVNDVVLKICTNGDITVTEVCTA